MFTRNYKYRGTRPNTLPAATWDPGHPRYISWVNNNNPDLGVQGSYFYRQVAAKSEEGKGSKDAMLYNFILKYLVLNYECTFPFSQTAWGKSIGIENVSWPD